MVVLERGCGDIILDGKAMEGNIDEAAPQLLSKHCE